MVMKLTTVPRLAMSAGSFTLVPAQHTDLFNRTVLLLFYLYMDSKVTGRMK